jgi:DNA-binding IclR family transcriptional regulator
LFRLVELKYHDADVGRRIPEAAREGNPAPRPSGVGALDRAAAVLDAVEAGARTFTDVVAATGLPRPTVHRLLRALVALGFLSREDDRGYGPGPRLLRLAASALGQPRLRGLARPVLERLARETGESAQLYIRSGDRRICVDAVESRQELRTIVEVGASLPLTAGSAGKVFLAWAGDAERLVGRAERLTPATPTGERLRRELRAIRRRGWAASSGERQPGVGSVSAPVLGPGGELVAAVSISGPEARMGRAAARRLAPLVQEAAREVAAGLGGPT